MRQRPEIGAIDTMIGFPLVDLRGSYREMLGQIRDQQTHEEFEMPVEYMFKGVPEKGYGESGDRDPVLYTLSEMDRWGVDVGLVSVGKGDAADAAVARFPERFVGSFAPNPNEGVEAIRKIRAAHDSYGLRALTFFPAGFSPQVPIDHRLMYPIYSVCVELGLPVFVTAGIAGPRVPSACQHVELVEQVLYDFPELTFVLRHGAEPWADLAIKLMVKWPNLHYSTSAFSPRYYPKAVIDYANSRGADRLIYGGYFPMGLSLERIMTEMGDVPLRDDVWPGFLRDNAARVLGIDHR
jgi:predicted TIM-barrel fold metal-dependent hydrolase